MSAGIETTSHVILQFFVTWVVGTKNYYYILSLFLFLSYFELFYLLNVGVHDIVALYHTQSRAYTRTSALVMTPLDEGSARRGDLYVTTHRKRQT